MHEQHLSGPDFLDAYAQQNLSSGLEINAAELSKRANEWKADFRALSQLTAEHEALQRAAHDSARKAAEAYDVLSTVRPSADTGEEYERARLALARLGDVQFGPPAWDDRADPEQRDPRTMPLPGDRLFLPVRVLAAEYSANEVTVTYTGMDLGQDGSLSPSPISDLRFRLPARSAAGAIGVVAAPARSLGLAPGAIVEVDGARSEPRRFHRALAG